MPTSCLKTMEHTPPRRSPSPSAKRQRQQPQQQQHKQKKEGVSLLSHLCSKRQWQQATQRVLSHPEEASQRNPQGATPLALACRNGAPFACIQALLRASPEQLRLLLPSRGTPLHEAIVCEDVGADAIQLLLETDERLEPTSQRTTLMQDVDGHTPLHLLIRRRSQSHIVWGGDNNWLPLLELLVKSCPDAVGIPDRGEYEEPPLVMALKASLYAGADYETDECAYPRIERRILEMVQTMLRHYPQAASRVLTGARGQYTALHSAVFHGRCSDTIELLLQAEQEGATKERRGSDCPAALLANTQGELPLHFAAMRGEPPRSIGLLGDSAPMAVLKRDASGLTPLHWLWIRFVSTLLSLDDRGETGAIQAELPAIRVFPGDFRFTQFWNLERGDFYADLTLIRRLDPPVDFLRMRHIPPELWECSAANSTARWAERAVDVLRLVKERSLRRGDAEKDENDYEWTRQEAVTCLFWVKAVLLLKSAATTLREQQQETRSEPFSLLHAAFTIPACPPAIAHMACLLFGDDDLMVRDGQGRLPLHLAARRDWQTWDLRTEEQESAAAQLLRGESLNTLRTAIAVSPTRATRVADGEGRLVLHHTIETFVRACSSRSSIMAQPAIASMLDVISDLLKLNPESLERRDGRTKLYPFMQATACATEQRAATASNGFPVPFPDEMPLSIVYMLLRENPSLVQSALE